MRTKLFGCLFMLCIVSSNSFAMATVPPHQIPICITPTFEFRCFLDKFSVPGMLTVMATTLGMYYVHKSCTAYANRHTTLLANNSLVSEPIMVTKAKNYGLAAATLLATAAAIYWRQPLAIGIAKIATLIH